MASRRASRSAYARTSSLDLDDDNHTRRYLKLLVKYKSSGTCEGLWVGPFLLPYLFLLEGRWDVS